MDLLTRVAATVGLFALAMAGSITAVQDVSAAPGVVGHVYVNDLGLQRRRRWYLDFHRRLALRGQPDGALLD